jgi:hypothetical protein
MNQSFCEQKQPARLGRPPPAQVADRRPAQEQKTGLSSGSTRGFPSHLHHRLAPVR